MTLEQFKYVLEVEKTGSINKAAANLYMTQSALSLSILSLERELGRHIFSRTNKGVAITPFGKTLLQYLRPIQDQIEQVNKIFVPGRRRENMIFTFANDGFTCGSLLCGILYQKYRPIGLRIEYYDGAGDQARTMVADQTAEVGLVRVWSCYKKIELRQMDTLGLEFHPLIEGDLAVVVGTGNPLYYNADVKSVTREMLQQYPRIMYGYEDWGPLARNVEALGIIDARAPIVTTSRAAITDMQTYSDAYYITTNVPEDVVCKHRMTLRRILPLEDVNIRSTIGWIARRNAPLSQVAQEFTMLLEQWYRNEIDEDLFCEGLKNEGAEMRHWEI